MNGFCTSGIAASPRANKAPSPLHASDRAHRGDSDNLRIRAMLRGIIGLRLPIGSEPLVANRENIVRHVAKLYNDLGSASGQPFARAQIERHAAPTPIGDLTLDRNEG